MPPRNTAFLDVCRGRRPARRPIWIMRQAGRYLPEYRAVRAKVSFEKLCRTPELCAEVTLQPIDRFDLDAAILFSDILTVLDTFGLEVTFAPGPKLAAPVRSAADLDRLEARDLEESVGYVFAAVRACKDALAGRVPLIGFSGAPLTVASYMVEGAGSADYRHLKALAWGDSGAFDALLGRVADVTCAYLEGQVRAGADALQIFESWGGALVAREYAALAWPHMRRVLAHALGLGVPVIAFLRGGAPILRAVGHDLPEGDLVVGVDWGVPLDEAIDILGPERVVQGNLDPVALMAPPQVLDARARRVMAAGAGARGHVFNLGHGISKDTDPQRVAQLVRLVHEEPP